MEFWVTFWIVGHFEQWKEDVVQELLEVIHQFVRLENITARNDTWIV